MVIIVKFNEIVDSTVPNTQEMLTKNELLFLIATLLEPCRVPLIHRSHQSIVKYLLIDQY